jgi:hypothetical protein
MVDVYADFGNNWWNEKDLQKIPVFWRQGCYSWKGHLRYMPLAFRTGITRCLLLGRRCKLQGFRAEWGKSHKSAERRYRNLPAIVISRRLSNITSRCRKVIWSRLGRFNPKSWRTAWLTHLGQKCPKSLLIMGPEGIEPSTNGLWVHCSTAELRARSDWEDNGFCLNLQ